MVLTGHLLKTLENGTELFLEANHTHTHTHTHTHAAHTVLLNNYKVCARKIPLNHITAKDTRINTNVSLFDRLHWIVLEVGH